jgi:CheY-like chemotaxis protein
VLAVDDNKANLVSLDAVLGAEYDLVFAESGSAAVDIVRQRSDLDVVLLDVNMPGMDGFETAAIIKTLPGAEDLPIVFISAVYTQDPYVKRAFEVGGVDYFTKPFDPKLMRTKLGIYAASRLKLDRVRQELRQVESAVHAALDGPAVGVLVVDAQGQVLHVTDELARVLCGSPQELSADRFFEWWSSDDNPVRKPGGPLAIALGLGESAGGEAFEIRCMDGTVKNVRASASPLRGRDGTPFGAAVVFQDLSWIVALEAELQIRLRKYESAATVQREDGPTARDR